MSALTGGGFSEGSHSGQRISSCRAAQSGAAASGCGDIGAMAASLPATIVGSLCDRASGKVRCLTCHTLFHGRLPQWGAMLCWCCIVTAAG